MMNARELNQFEVRQYWPEAEDHLRSAVRGVDPVGYLRNVQAALFAGLNTLWRIEEDGDLSAYCVTNIYSTDGVGAIAQIHLFASDDMKKALPLLDYFTVWAKRRGVDYIEVIGRKGWERALKPYGFRHEYTSLFKRITEEIH